MKDVIDNLLNSDEPAIRWKTRVNVLGEPTNSPSLLALQQDIKRSTLASQLITLRNAEGKLDHPSGVYAKWQGAHWTLAVLADIGYPAGDEALLPAREQLLDHWLRPTFYQEFTALKKADAYRSRGVPVMEDRHRRCASQQSNALWSILKLGLVNARTHDLVERLLHWQWPDGGWNCDKNPAAAHSSFMESILPLRALAHYGHTFNHEEATRAARRAAEIFLKRRLYLGEHSGIAIRTEFTALHYPLYWHYDVLHGLKVMAEGDFIKDPRCNQALDLLESKRLKDGGWPAEKKYYKSSAQLKPGNDFVNWGGTSKVRLNEWVTVDALFVLKAAGRLG